MSGGHIAWTLAVSNHGPSTAHKVTVVDPLPSGSSYLSSSTSQGTCAFAAGKLTCEVGTLANGASAQIAVAALVSAAPGTLSNTATVSAEEPDPEPANNSSTVLTQVLPLPSQGSGVLPAAASADPRARVTLRKLVNHSVVAQGGRLDYRLVVRDISAETARHLEVCDRLPAQTTVVSRGAGKLSAGRICFALPSLAAGHRHVFRLVLRVDSNARGRVVNHATVTGENFARTAAHVATRVRGAVLPRRESAVTG